MSSNSEEPMVIERPPVYYRWRDERSPLIVEVKLDLVPRITADLQAAENLGLEGGGILVGCFPKSVGPPTLRIEDYELVGRRGGDGLPYLLLAEQRQRFTAVRKRVATREVSAVGYFRSHLRTGPFELTIVDRDLLAVEFKNSIHVALLIGKDQSDASHVQRFLATYFVSVNGIIQNRIDPLTFPFDEAKLEALNPGHARLHVDVPPMPKLMQVEDPAKPKPAEPPAAPVAEPSNDVPAHADGKRVRLALRLGLAAVALLAMLFAVWGWQRQGSRLTAGVLPGPDQGLALAVTRVPALGSQRTALQIDWNRQSPQLLDARTGHLTITNSQTHQTIRELDLMPNELSQGSVRVEMDAQAAEVTLVVSLANATQITQMAPAPGQP